VSSFLTARQHN